MTTKIESLEKAIAALKSQKSEAAEKLKGNLDFENYTQVESSIEVLNEMLISEKEYEFKKELGAFQNPEIEVYDPTAKNAVKARFILNRFKKPMTSKEISNEITKLEPNEKIEKINASLSSLLGIMATSKKLFTVHEQDFGSKKYGLIEWNKE